MPKKKPNKPALPVFILITAFALPLFLTGTNNTPLVYRVFFDSNPIGTETYSQEITGDKTIKTVAESDISFDRGHSVIRMMKKGIFVETLDNDPVSFFYSDTSGDKKKELHGKIENNLLLVESPMRETVSYPLDSKIFFYSGLKNLVKKSILENKQDFSYSFYSPDQENILQVQNSVMEKKEGVVTIKAIYNSAPGIEIFEKWDPSGTLLEQEIPILKYKKILVAGTEGAGSPVGAPRFDIHSLNTVETVNTFRLDTSTVKAVYEISTEGLIDIPVSDNQTIVEKNDKGIIISTGKPLLENNTHAVKAPQSEDTSEFLRSNAFLQTGDDRIKQVIDELNPGNAGMTLDEWVKRIHSWVMDNITVRSLNMNFAAAKEILDKKEGDCSEFSVLFASLLRQAGIPSRVCFGLIYMDRLFRFHFWTEYFAGKWLSLDPSRKTGTIDARYIKFMDTSLNDMSETGLGLLVLKYLKVKKITVLNAINKEGLPNE